MFGARSLQACPPAIVQSYKDNNFTDLTITCGSLTFQVHIVVVCSSCEFFKKSVKFPGGKESSEKHIDLPEDDPEMIRRLITYLYLGDYDPSNSWDPHKFKDIDQQGSTTTTSSTYHPRLKAFGTSATDPCACLAPNLRNIVQLPKTIGSNASSLPTCTKAVDEVQVANPLTIHATMYALGDKYHVQGLCELAKEKFESCLQHHAHSEDFVSAVQIVYSSTPDSNRNLRDSVLGAFRTQFQTDITQIPGAEAKLDSIDELSFHLIKSWPTKIEEAKPARKSRSRDPNVRDSPSPLPATRPATSLFAGSGAPASLQPTAPTQPAATRSFAPGFAFGDALQPRPSASTQPATTTTGTTSVFVSPQPAASSQSRTTLSTLNSSAATTSQSSSALPAATGSLFGGSTPRSGLFGNLPART
ncbi:hypothetical protein IQ06DRAFT_136109 [Phaeosphaeriaceae sp. SRC1lsM3a]|nr:hypothetical protein IQ06DRAFT_136109 [Stagonospora sp. SRC1lsM3a]